VLGGWKIWKVAASTSCGLGGSWNTTSAVPSTFSFFTTAPTANTDYKLCARVSASSTTAYNCEATATYPPAAQPATSIVTTTPTSGSVCSIELLSGPDVNGNVNVRLTLNNGQSISGYKLRNFSESYNCVSGGVGGNWVSFPLAASKDVEYDFTNGNIALPSGRYNLCARVSVSSSTAYNCGLLIDSSTSNVGIVADALTGLFGGGAASVVSVSSPTGNCNIALTDNNNPNAAGGLGRFTLTRTDGKTIGGYKISLRTDSNYNCNSFTGGNWNSFENSETTKQIEYDLTSGNIPLAAGTYKLCARLRESPTSTATNCGVTLTVGGAGDLNFVPTGFSMPAIGGDGFRATWTRPVACTGVGLECSEIDGYWIQVRKSDGTEIRDSHFPL
ncbi:MAG: hypothetical protein AAB368_09785, partial [bacterium]